MPTFENCSLVSSCRPKSHARRITSEFGHDVSSIWLSLPEEENHTNSLGYRLSLFDDGGREIASKAVSTQTADEFLALIKVRV